MLRKPPTLSTRPKSPAEMPPSLRSLIQRRSAEPWKVTALEPEPVERVEHDRLQPGDHRVEVHRRAGSVGFGSISPNMTAQPAS